MQFVEGSLLLMGRTIVAIASIENTRLSLLKITFDDFVGIETRIRSSNMYKKKKNSCEDGSSSKAPRLE